MTTSQRLTQFGGALGTASMLAAIALYVGVYVPKVCCYKYLGCFLC